jgi:hypothetical protein
MERQFFTDESVGKIFGKSNGFAAGYGKSISKRIHLPPSVDEEEPETVGVLVPHNF